MLNFGDAAASNLLKLACQLIGLVELFHIITASDTLAHQQNVRNGSSTGHCM